MASQRMRFFGADRLTVLACCYVRMVRKAQSGKSPNKKRKTEEGLMFSSYSSTSVHKRNLCIVSFPIIFLFNILRSLLYQIFVIIRFVYCSSSNYFVRGQTPNVVLEENSVVVEEIAGMSHVQRNPGPGPGDPLLAKQKHHHRRAFEYISKALKIDEENEGKRRSLKVSPSLKTYQLINRLNQKFYKRYRLFVNGAFSNLPYHIQICT